MKELGTGVLDWDREERVSDRYGFVKLFTGPRSTIREEITLATAKAQTHGRLIAVVREVREVDHIGDFFHRVFPTIPELGEKVILGEGTVCFENNGVGLLPDDGRTALWLDIRALYRIHNQTVTLFFEAAPLN
jgi:hypothetical protein